MDVPQPKADGKGRRGSLGSQNSQTAKEYIDSQMQMEADAREALPYSFDSCTYALGPLRQNLFACLTCNPPTSTEADKNTSTPSAAVCYSCSITCHGEHTLVELFNKRNFVCDCGTTRMPPSAPCTLREDPKTGSKGVHSQEAAPGNQYNQNFQNRFCGCGEQYDPHIEKGTMFQCLGVGTVETGGCGEDWWHPECLIGLQRTSAENNTTLVALGGGDAAVDGAGGAAEEDEETPLPPGFPAEDDFWQLICFKCLDSNPWLKRYAGTPGFLPPVFKEGGLKKISASDANKSTANKSTANKSTEEKSTADTLIADNSKKRKANDESESQEGPKAKRAKEETFSVQEPQSQLSTIDEEPANEKDIRPTPASVPTPKHASLPKSAPVESFSLFVQENFYDRLCRCPECFPHLANHPQLREEEDTYEPPLSEDGDANGAPSTGTGSILERGEAAFNNIDRVRAIEGAFVYNHLRDKVKEFLKPFAESGQAVRAEDIKEYFEKLRGDDQGIKDAAGHASTMSGGGRDDPDENNRHEQNGY
ncbi:hypothetical protein NUU61_003388 [Penicillium alfredii]|uniref:UBR-type domain-containing protein n=1 Tax=Penicillium alfredii TaxID=1506179 RepID=A0A9W9FT94_9EURO|nr:uncharacterized protein NUU61_003388 [Penicillium alfredii]KAJ5106041.1 hypothetical protein NUU61_003388 [Penicillium alfredii]